MTRRCDKPEACSSIALRRLASLFGTTTPEVGERREPRPEQTRECLKAMEHEESFEARLERFRQRWCGDTPPTPKRRTEAPAQRPEMEITPEERAAREAAQRNLEQAREART